MTYDRKPTQTPTVSVVNITEERLMQIVSERLEAILDARLPALVVTASREAVKPELYTVQEAAHTLNLSVSKVRYLIGKGLIETVNHGRNIRISREALEAFIEMAKIPVRYS